MTVVVIELLE